MSKIALVIARPDSSRLPDKHNRKIGSLTVMDWIIKNLHEVVDDIVISTTERGIPYYKRYISARVSVVAPEPDDNNVLSRIRKTAEIHTGKYYLIISGDCPLISVPIMRDMLKRLMVSRDFDACMIGEGTSHLGADAINLNGIKKLGNGEHLSLRMVPNLNIFSIFILPNVYADFRATVDNFADLAFMNECFKQLSDKFTFEGVSDYVNANPLINKLNEHVNQKPIGHTTDKPNVAFITEGNEHIGMGHVARSIALAQYYNEVCHKHIHFYVNNHKLVKEMLKSYGYQYELDYTYTLPVLESEAFDSWMFIKDTYNETTFNYDQETRCNPSFAVNYRNRYIPNEINTDCVVSFGKGKFVDYGNHIFNELATGNNRLLISEPDIKSYLKGTDRIITVWSQTAREAISIGKQPEVYSTNAKDDKLCKYLNTKGVIKWKGNLFKKIQLTPQLIPAKPK